MAIQGSSEALHQRQRTQDDSSRRPSTGYGRDRAPGRTKPLSSTLERQRSRAGSASKKEEEEWEEDEGEEDQIKEFQKEYPDSARNKYTRLNHDTVAEYKGAVVGFLEDTIGSSDLTVHPGDDKKKVHYSKLESLKGRRLMSTGSLLAQCQTPVHHAGRLESFGPGVSKNRILNMKDLEDCEFVWAVRRFPLGAESGIKETDLIASSSIFGHQGEKLYLHAVINHKTRGLNLLPLQQRGGKGVKKLPRDVKTDYVNVHAAGEPYRDVYGSLPPLFLCDRKVPEGLTLFLMLIPVSFDDYLYPAQGHWEPLSRALMCRYVDASVQHKLRLYAKATGISDKTFQEADAVLTKRIGSIDAYFDSEG